MDLSVRLCAVSIAVMAVGCSSSEPVDAGEAGARDAGQEMDCGSLAWAGTACASCTAMNCCSLESICAAIPSCTPLSECTVACGADAGCATACSAMHIDSVSNYNAVLNCQSQSCASECTR
jgi:hypothetical protein